MIYPHQWFTWLCLTVENSGDPRKAKTRFNNTTWNQKRDLLRRKLGFEQTLGEFNAEAKAGAERREKERIELLHRKLDSLTEKRPASAKRLVLRSNKQVSKFNNNTWNEQQRQLMDGIDEYASLSRRNRKSLAQILREFQERVEETQPPGCEPIIYDPVFLEEFGRLFEPPGVKQERLAAEQATKRPLSPKNQKLMAHWNAVAAEMKGKETVGDQFRQVLCDNRTRSLGPISKKKNEER